MNALVVAINLMQDGERSIARLIYNPTKDADAVAELCRKLEEKHDEVYIINGFDPNDRIFIDEIVKRGCRY